MDKETLAQQHAEDTMFFTLQMFANGKTLSIQDALKLFKTELQKQFPLWTDNDIKQSIYSHINNKTVEWSSSGRSEIDNMQITPIGRIVYDNAASNRRIEKTVNDLDQRVKESTVTANRWSPVWAFFAALFAFLSACAAIYDAVKDSEKLTPSLQKLDTTLQYQNRSLENIEKTLQNVEGDLQKIIDSSKKQ